MRSRGRFADWDGDRWGDIVLGLAVHDCWGMVREKRIEEGRRRGRGGGDGTDWDTGTDRHLTGFVIGHFAWHVVDTRPLHFLPSFIFFTIPTHTHHLYRSPKQHLPTLVDSLHFGMWHFSIHSLTLTSSFTHCITVLFSFFLFLFKFQRVAQALLRRSKSTHMSITVKWGREKYAYSPISSSMHISSSLYPPSFHF